MFAAWLWWVMYGDSDVGPSRCVRGRLKIKKVADNV